MRQTYSGHLPGARLSWEFGGRKTDAPTPQNYWFFCHLLTASEAAEPSTTAEQASEIQKLQAVEAVLFVAKDALSSRKLAQVAGLADATEARTLVRLLNHRYDSMGRVFRVEEVAGGYCLLTRPQFAPWLRRMRVVPGEMRLTQSALETLAIVAYRQPVPRADIEAIRGVSSGEILKQLMEKDLVRICGRSEDLGRPYLYGTTRYFLQMFGLRSADRLPRSEWINGPTGIAPSVTRNLLEPTREHDTGTGTDAKESTVKHSFSAATLLQDSIAPTDELLLDQHVVRAVDDDDDEFYDDDEDEDDDDMDEDEDYEDDDEDFDDEDEELEDDEEGFEEEEEEGDWEEVDDEDEEEEEEESEDDDWDDEEDDWDDDEEEEEDEEEEWD